MKITEFNYVGTHNVNYKDYVDGTNILIEYEGKYESDPVKIIVFTHCNKDKSTIEFMCTASVNTDRIFLDYRTLPETIQLDLNDSSETLTKMLYSPLDYIRKTVEQKGNIKGKVDYLSSVLRKSVDYLNKNYKNAESDENIFFARGNCRKYAVRANNFLNHNKYKLNSVGCNRVHNQEEIEGYKRESEHNRLYTVGINKIYKDTVIRQYILLEFIGGEDNIIKYAPITYHKDNDYFSLSGEVKSLKLSRLETSNFSAPVISDRLVEQYGITDYLFEDRMKEIDNGTYLAGEKKLAWA
jgi:hypothetical protein